MAERRGGHHLCRDRRHPVRAARRSGLRCSRELHGRHCLSAVLPRPSHLRCCRMLETFAAFSLVIGLVLVPAGAAAGPAVADGDVYRDGDDISCRSSRPTNPMSYDTSNFTMPRLAIVAGAGAAALSFRLLPPLSPAFRTRRLLALTLRDLRRLATGRSRTRPTTGRAACMARLAAGAGSGAAIAALAAAGGVFGQVPRSSSFATSAGGSILGLDLGGCARRCRAGQTARRRPQNLAILTLR